MVKRLLMIVILVVIPIWGMAQIGTVKHIVDRGETLASIAKMYGTTEAKIIELNPSASQFIFVGMELTIPTSEKVEKLVDGNPEKQVRAVYTTALPSSQEMNYEVGGTYQSVRNDNVYLPSDFAHCSLSFYAGFENVKYTSFYMFGGEILGDSGWGVDFYIGADYGLVEKDYAGSVFFIGPAYGHVFGNLLISSSFDFVGFYVGTGESMKERTNAMGETSSYKGIDSKFQWGFALMPKLTYKVGKVYPWGGINAMWAKGADKLSLGFQIGIGFKI